MDGMKAAKVSAGAKMVALYNQVWMFIDNFKVAVSCARLVGGEHDPRSFDL